MLLLAQVIARGAILISGIALVVILVLVAGQIGMRVFIGDSLPWSDELARLAFIYLVFIGAAETSARNVHISVDLKHIFGLSERVDRFLDVFRMVIVIAILGVVAVGSWQIIPVVQNMELPATRASTAWLYVPVLIGSVLMIVATVINLVTILIGNKLPLEDQEEAE